MGDEPDVDEVAEAVLAGVSLLVRRVRQSPVEGELSMPERSAMSRLARNGPATSAALARLEQISPQSMGATLARLEARGVVQRGADPSDGRRVVLSLTAAGVSLLRTKRSARSAQLARALADGFSEAELVQLAAAAPLLERLGRRL